MPGQIISFSLLIRLRDWHIRGMLSRGGPLFQQDVNTWGPARPPPAWPQRTQVGVQGTEPWPGLDEGWVLAEHYRDYDIGLVSLDMRHQTEIRSSQQAAMLTCKVER